MMGVVDDDTKIGGLNHLNVIWGIAKGDGPYGGELICHRAHLVCFGGPERQGQKPATGARRYTLLAQVAHEIRLLCWRARPNPRL